MKSGAVLTLVVSSVLMVSSCEESSNGEMSDDCTKKLILVEVPQGKGYAHKKIFACDGRGVTQALIDNCAALTVDLCYRGQDIEGCEWEGVASTLTDEQFTWVSSKDSAPETRVVRVTNWGCK